MFINKLDDYVVLLAYLVKLRNTNTDIPTYIDLYDRIDTCERKIVELVSAQMNLEDGHTMTKLIEEIEGKEGK